MPRSLSRGAAIQAIDRLRDDLNSALDQIDEYRRNPDSSPEQQSYLNDYAVVRMAGFLEQLCFHAISGRVGEITKDHLQDFINSWFFKAPNLDAEQFRKLFKRFGGSVDDEIKDFLGRDLNRDVLNSLMERRNAVAHGKESPTSGAMSLASYRNLVANMEIIVKRLLLDEPAFIL